MTYDVGIIGAGLHGCAVAFHLARPGLRVALFERESPASGPTGRSDALCAAYTAADQPFLASCIHDTIEMLRGFRELTGHDAEWHSSGMLFVHALEDVPTVSKAAEMLADLGVAIEVLELDELAVRFPQLDLTGLGVGCWLKDAGYADPWGVTTGFFSGATARGVEPHLHQQVTAIHLEDRGGATLEVGQDRIYCAQLLVAAGPWTGPLLRTADIDLPLSVVRHYVGAFRWGKAAPLPALGSFCEGFYLRPEGGDLFVAGTGGELHAKEPIDPATKPRTVTYEQLVHLASVFVQRVPQLELAEPMSGWACMYDMSPDHMPVIGEVAPGVYVDAGTSGNGFQTGLALSRHIANLLLGAQPASGLEQFHPSRFAEGRTLANMVP